MTNCRTGSDPQVARPRRRGRDRIRHAVSTVNKDQFRVQPLNFTPLAHDSEAALAAVDGVIAELTNQRARLAESFARLAELREEGEDQ